MLQFRVGHRSSFAQVARRGVGFLAVCYVRHGMLCLQVPDKDGDEADGKDEALVATDINLISVRIAPLFAPGRQN